ncbi:MAG: protein kinase [Alphaproteobacteria bacterium]|nr:protein kinase [Alphaproteobacteria bacterium]MCB9795356.1 protein kinase [Alphaproteobacteria bacterium]
MSPEPFGRYTLVDTIGAGGMAEVFRATLSAQAGVQKQLVVKRILRSLSAEPAFVEMFIDEARIAAQLQHPNVVQVFDFGQVEDHWFMAMEWVDGLNLHHLLRQLAQKRVFLPLDFALYIAHEAAKGLHYAHTLAGADGQPLGLVHRDICPQNLLISWRGDVKLADFGIAKSAANTYTTQGVTLKGHTSYMSPEQTRGHALDGRSDLFSLCVVLWEALTGRRLFRTDDPVLTLERIRLAEVPPPRDIRPEVPQAIEDLLLAGLNADPEARPADARALQLGLARPLLPETPDEVRERFAAWLEESCAELIAMSPRLRGSVPPPFSALPELPEEDEPTVIAEAAPEPVTAEVPSAPAAPIEPAPIEPSVSGTLSLGEEERERRGLAWWWALAPLLLVVLALGLWAGGGEDAPPRAVVPESVEAPGASELDEADAASGEVDAPSPSPEGAPEALGDVREAESSDAKQEASGPSRAREAARAEPPPSVFDKPGYRGTPAEPGLEPEPVEALPSEPEGAPEGEPVVEPADVSPPPEAPPAVDPATPGSVSVRLASGWGQLRIDGKRVRGSTPFESVSLTPGTHLIQVEVPSTGRVWSKEITLEPGQHLDLVFD